MRYYNQLLTEDWKNIRLDVLSRDSYCCQNCYNEIYLNNSSANMGFVESISCRYNYHSFKVNTFSKKKMFCKISENQLPNILVPSLIYFERTEDCWANILASRELTVQERIKYIDFPKSERDKIYKKMIAEKRV